MVDIALLYAGLAVTLAGVALIFLGALGYLVYGLVQDRLDLRAGVPLPSDTAAPETADPAPARELQPTA